MKKMFTKSEEILLIDEEIKEALGNIRDSTYDEDYDELVERLERLVKVRKELKPNLISKENAPLIANLVGIGMILWHEKAHVITTKALGFVVKGRV